VRTAYVLAIAGAALAAFYTASFALQEWREGRRPAATAAFFLAAAAVAAPLYLALRRG